MIPIRDVLLPDNTVLDLGGPDSGLPGVDGDQLLDEDGVVLAARCPVCCEWYDVADWAAGSRWGAMSRRRLCEACAADDIRHASTLFRLEGGVRESVAFGDAIAEGPGGEVPDWFAALVPDEWEERPYRFLDGGRGFYDTASVLPLRVLASGWSSSAYEERLSWTQDMHRFVAAIVAGTLVTPAPLYVLLEATSALGGGVTSLLCAERDADAMIGWLRGQSFDAEEALR
jgi:hypothetical protein